jgi:hypothetical protein
MLILNNKWTIEKIILKHELLIKKTQTKSLFRELR